MDDNKIGMNIKKYRKGKFTQQELANKIGKTESSIRKYEKGLVTIPLDVLNKIATALEVTVADLMGIAYFDTVTDTKALADEVKHLESFEKYLNFLGFSVEMDATEWHYENPDETNPAEKVPIMDNPKYILSKEGKAVIFTSEEYDDLEKSANESAKEKIELKFYEKFFQQDK